MKKVLLILALLAVAAFSFTVVDRVYAQTDVPPTPEPGFGPGMMGGRGFGSGRMGGAGIGLMHDAMVDAFAEKLGLSVEEINTRLDAGETMFDIAAEADMTLEDFRTLMTDARAQALDDAVAAGTITQEQADFMKERGGGRMGGPGQGGRAGCPFVTQPAE